MTGCRMAIALSLSVALVGVVSQAPAQILEARGKLLGGRGRVLMGERPANSHTERKAKLEAAPNAGAQWNIAVEAKGQAFQGKIRADGLDPRANEANIQGSIAGNTVAGSVTDASGRQLGTFEGQLIGGYLNGTFRTSSGVEGVWGWEGRLQ